MATLTVQQLALDLLAPDSPTKGAGQVGYDIANVYPPRTVGSRLQRARNLEDFRYNGNTPRNDQDTVQAALNAGGVLHVTQSYSLTNTAIITQNGTTLIGRGGALRHETSLRAKVLAATGLSNISVVDLEIDGRKSLKSGTGAFPTYGIDISDCDKWSVVGCYVHDCFEHGIRFGSVDDTPTPKTTNGLVANNISENNGNSTNGRGWGIWGIKKVDGLVVHGNRCVDNEAGGIMVDDTHNPVDGLGGSNILIAGNLVRSGKTTWSAASRGIQISGESDFVISANRVQCGYAMGIAVTAGQAGTRTGSGNVSNNVVSASGEYGILVDTARRINVTNNQIFSTGATAAAAIDLGNQSIGEAPMIDVQVEGNFILASTVGIQHGRRTSHNTTSNNLTIRGNTVRKTGATTSLHRAIDVNDAQGTAIIDNTVSSFYDGIYFSTSATNNLVQGNTVASCANVGIRTAQPTRVVHNICRNNAKADLEANTGFNNAASVLGWNNFASATRVTGSIASITNNNFNLPALP
jgi:parallel beta-helix repeat protein